MLSTFEVFLRLFAATVAGGVIGIERERHSQPAGFRTHILVTLGAALIMIISTTKYAPGTVRNDPMRLASQVVSGIGFLGAGTILKEGPTIRGLTSATGLWVCAAIGLAFGAGMYREGVLTAGFAFLTLTVLIRWERKLFKEKFKKQDLIKVGTASEESYLELYIVRDLSKGLVEDIEDALRDHQMLVARVHINRGTPPKEVDIGDRGILEFTILPEAYQARERMDGCLRKLQSLPGVESVGVSVADLRGNV
ncbi:Mg2+ transporter-C family protein [Aedoeadaptatus nemausensis]|uniref:Mg2+ transporter-C family protein n=1 Tax=Aedoeadaptatus nemausensis TaxID=2582829 RepID=A0A6V6Y3F7_9FIRM|nr:MgtC/SapB family protein [Peptoniphilus nemausensis]CAC9930225.1 Mg2+ transporter-C family protein [Peptoniphilus nemausensis]